MSLSRNVHHLHVTCKSIPLNMKRFASLTTSEEGCCWLHPVVVTLPYLRRPARMTHPDKQSLTILCARLEHGTITVVIYPLCQAAKLTSVSRLAERTLHHGIKRSTTLCATLCEVVSSPLFRLRPQSFRRERTRQSLVCHHIGHATLGMELSGLLGEVSLSRFSPVRTVTADTLIGRTWDVEHARIGIIHKTLQRRIQSCRRISLVSSTVESDAGMATHTASKV